ncbi:hypothetical protein K439DRAFT_956757 [Ramaria rubella]|nr:hypothetical protein K439DRAFT_956757 [Ramaria rubella]
MEAKDAALVASLMLVLYHHVLTVDDEIEEIWNFRPYVAGILIIVMRYFNVLAHILAVFAHNYTPVVCLMTEDIKITSLTSIVIIMLRTASSTAHLNHNPINLSVIMILRIYALRGTYSLVTVFLTLLLISEIIVMGFLLYVGSGSQDNKNLTQCQTSQSIGQKASVYFKFTMATSKVSKNLGIFWMVPLLGDTAIFFATFQKNREYARSTRRIPLFHLLWRGGLLYYSIIFITHGVTFLLYLLAPLEIRSAASSFSQALAPILVSKLFFDFRKQARQQCSNHDSTHSGQLSSYLYNREAEPRDTIYVAYLRDPLHPQTSIASKT